MPTPSQLAPSAPPGFLSPAAFPYPNGPFPLPNDAPPTTPQPYLIAQGTSSATSASVTIPAQTPTGRGDAIIVFATANATVPGTASDTQGNAYSLASWVNTTVKSLLFVAQNTKALGAGDSITVTFGSAPAFPKDVIVVGVPANCYTANFTTAMSGPYLTYDTRYAPSTNGRNAIGGVGSNFALTPALGVSSVNQPVLVICGFASSSAAGPPNFGQDWTPFASYSDNAGSANSSHNVLAYKFVTSNAQGTVAAWVEGLASGSQSILLVALYPETRFAPNRPAPDMPPGMQSPGAWQFAPAIPAGPAGIHYNPGPNKWAEILPAAPASHAAMTRSTGKQALATPHPAGALARGVSKGLAAAPRATGKLVKSAARILAATAHPAGALTRAAGKHLTATAHAAGVLARSTGKHLAAAGHPLGTLLTARARTLAATVHPAGKLARSTGKRLAATAHPAAAILRARAMVLAARIISAARLLTATPAPVFNLGIPGTEWSVSISTIGISQLSTQYVLIPVAAAKAGASYDPTTHPVQFAFMPTATKVPGSSDWVAGSWEAVPSNLIYPYTAKCLVGPSGTINPGIGTYVMYVKITENPDIPVLIAGYLRIN